MLYLKTIRSNKALILIITLAIFLRFFKLGSFPPSLNWDETSIGYTVNSILQTGKDEWGEPPSLAFRSFGDYKPTLYFYTDLLPIKLFGLNPTSVRLPSALFSTLLVLATYFLVKKLFNDKKLALFSAFILTVSPWAIHMGRPAFEAALMAFLFVLGILFFKKGLEKEKYLLLSAFSFGLTLIAYHSSRVILPVFIPMLILLYRKSLLPISRIKIFSLGIFTFFFMLILPLLFGVEGQSRFSQVSIFYDTGAITRNYENRFESFLPSPLAKLVYSKPVLFVNSFIRNFLVYFTNEFFFIQGGTWGTHTIYNIPNFGVLYIFEAPFFFLGLFYLFKKGGSSSHLLILWLLTAPLAAALTQAGGHPLRASLLTPVIQIIVAIGIYDCLESLREHTGLRKAVKFTLPIFYSVYLLLFLHYYFLVYPTKYAEVWQYQYKEAIDYISQVEDKYDTIVFTKLYGEPQIFLAYYKKIPPQIYQQNKNEFLRYQKEGFPWVDQLKKYSFGKYVFKYLDKSDFQSYKNTLFIGQQDDIPDGTYLLKKVMLPNGNTAFKITDSNLIESSIKDGKIKL